VSGLPVWRRDEDKGALALHVTAQGLAAIGAYSEDWFAGGRLSITIGRHADGAQAVVAHAVSQTPRITFTKESQ
jgi:hypothetical protein